MSKPEPKNYDMTFCTSDFCDSVKECARHIGNYQFDHSRRIRIRDFTNLIQECEHFEPLEETK
jgi:hypothetical protein